MGYYNDYNGVDNDVDDVSDDADDGGGGENNDDDVEVRVKARSALFGSTRPLWTGHDQSVRRHDDDSNDGENF